uniref:Uncharacterized protein n=1 Tax=Oryza sativa subsp. japonica TaxID=39947 RepID=Q69U06_ORYSJ|nr:hypothetical protein [Oryza sativa Japonica Group]BAD35671.1 hypothetical protein [Oryza sativa Japonica Group]
MHGCYTSGGRVAAASGAQQPCDVSGARSYVTTDDDAPEPVNPAVRSLASYSGHAIAAKRSRRIVGCDGEYHRRHPIRGISTPPPARRRHLPSSPARAARRRPSPPANRLAAAAASPPPPHPAAAASPPPPPQSCLASSAAPRGRAPPHPPLAVSSAAVRM